MTIIENFNKEETYGVSANTLVHGDCLEVMKCIKDKSIDFMRPSVWLNWYNGLQMGFCNFI